MRKLTAWWMVGLVLLSGCVPSLNAIYNDETLVFIPSVVGVWAQKGSTDSWDFQQRDDKSYRLIYTDRQGHTGSFVAHVADVDGTRFLDLFPEQIEDATPGFYRLHKPSIHTIYLVKEVGDTVVLAAIDYKWLEEYLEEHPNDVPSAVIGSHRMLTASTEQLQRFLVDNQDRFVHSIELERKASTNVN